MNLTKFQKDGKYLLLAFDHRGSFKKYVNKDNSEAASDKEIIEVKSLVIDALNDLMSGVLIDPVWGLPAYKKAGAGKPYLLCLEKTGYVESGEKRLNELQYTGAELKKWGASAAKILIYSNPKDKEATNRQLETSRQALREAHENDLPLFLEFVTYDNNENKKGLPSQKRLGGKRAKLIMDSLKIYIEAGVVPDVWKLEYPGDRAACEKITEIAGKTPWVLLTRGEEFDIFYSQLQDAISAGASGFLAGRALWQEIGDYREEKFRKDFLDKVVRKRFAEISKIALEEE